MADEKHHPLDTVDIDGLCRLLGRSEWTVRQWISTGQLNLKPLGLPGKDSWLVSDVLKELRRTQREGKPRRSPRGKVLIQHLVKVHASEAGEVEDEQPSRPPHHRGRI